jgi:hypothetical protein
MPNDMHRILVYPNMDELLQTAGGRNTPNAAY